LEDPQPERAWRALGRHQNSRQKENQSHIAEEFGLSVSLWELWELHRVSRYRGEVSHPPHCCYTAVKRIRT
jgi:hypothetical protein